MFLMAAVLSYADSQTEIFNRTTAYLDKGGILFQFHNTEKLSQQIEKLMQLGVENSKNVNAHIGMEFIRHFLKAIELKSLQGVGASVKDLSSDKMGIFPLYQNKVFVAVDPKSSGSVFAFAKNANGKLPYAGNLPANTIFATAVKLNFDNVFAEMKKSIPSDTLNTLDAVLVQNIGVNIADLLKNISGDCFFAVYNDNKPDSFHFIMQIADNNSVLKKAAKQRLAPLMRFYKDKSASFELPLPQGKFGGAYTVLFAQNKVFIYNSNAPLAKLLNVRKTEKTLVNVNSEVFGILVNCTGNSYTVINFDTASVAPEMPRKQYEAVSVGVMTPDGYLQCGKSNYEIFNFIEYFPLAEIVKNMKLNDKTSPLAEPLQ